jgi:small subunit ribosomal protein S9
MNEQSPSQPDPTPAPDAEPAPPAAPPPTPQESAPQQPAPPAPAPRPPAPAAPEPQASAEPAETGTPQPDAPKPADEPAPSPARAAKRPEAGTWWWGVGRRKAAVARVRIRPGDGKFIVNKRPHDQYMNEERDRNDVMAVLHKTKTAGSVDVHVNVRGGGFTGQAGAIVLGLGRALCRYDQTLEPILRENGFLTRDPRKVERKKYGQPGARRRFQFSKR